MTQAEARTILVRELAPYAALPFDQLLPLLKEVRTFKGEGYQGEIHAYWDDKSQHRLRLWAELSYSFWTSFVPVVECELVDNPSVGGKVA